MIIDLASVHIFIKPGKTDMRKQINGLSVLIEPEMGKAPFSGCLFLFCNRNKKLLKGLYWDRNGFCLFHIHFSQINSENLCP
ncbi:MAG: IS66 family insertion sequence element accessory protein TnpB [Spirochaetales bacterium]|nr:IS66 family insertion sequence element accessory protein TnpB [Spirochaetales bacterium]